MQAFQHLGGITSEQPVRMLPVDLQHFIKTPGGNECVGVLYYRRHVVVDVSQLRRQIAGFRHSSALDAGDVAVANQDMAVAKRRHIHPMPDTVSPLRLTPWTTQYRTTTHAR